MKSNPWILSLRGWMDGLVSILNEWSALHIYICLCVHFPDFTLCLHEVHKANTLISDQLYVCHTRFSALMSVKVWFILQYFPWLKCIQAMLDTSNIPLTHTFLLVAFKSLSKLSRSVFDLLESIFQLNIYTRLYMKL